MPPFALVELTHTLPRCGPSHDLRDAARAVLLVLPVLMLLFAPVFARLSRLWRAHWSSRTTTAGKRTLRVTFFLTLIGALAALPGADSSTFSLVLVAGWLVGASWAAWSLILWRVLVHRTPAWAPVWPPVIASALISAVAWLAFAGVGGEEPLAVIAGVVGLAGFTPAALVLAMVIESAVRGRLPGQPPVA